MWITSDELGSHVSRSVPKRHVHQGRSRLLLDACRHNPCVLGQCGRRLNRDHQSTCTKSLVHRLCIEIVSFPLSSALGGVLPRRRGSGGATRSGSRMRRRTDCARRRRSDGATERAPRNTVCGSTRQGPSQGGRRASRRRCATIPLTRTRRMIAGR